MDVVRAIGNVEVDSNDKPVKQVLINSITIENYSASTNSASATTTTAAK
jgi:hypothetical protein